MATTVCPATRAERRGVPRSRTSSTASPFASMRMTTVASRNTSAGVATTRAPSARSGAVRPAVRFHTTSGVPARARLSAIG